MIYITGDTRADFTRYNTENFPQQKQMAKDDYVIICGDYGGIWKKSSETEYWLKWLSAKPFTTLFVDGNHENFDMLNAYPVEEWNGGKVHKITPSVIHLMRGQVFLIDGKKIFAFGGAQSHDIHDGILDPAAPDFKEQYKYLSVRNALFRVKGISWWPEEMPNENEYTTGLKNLAAVDWSVDYVLTHCGPSSIVDIFSRGFYEHDELTDYLDRIREKTTFSKWSFGHYHDNREIGENFVLLYEQMIYAAGLDRE
jgi:hypothetical protein